MSIRHLVTLGLMLAILTGCSAFRALPPALVTATPAGQATSAEALDIQPPAAIPSFRADIRPMYGGCDCHGWEPGRFDPNTYDGTLRVVVPGDPEASPMVQMMRRGHHALPRLRPAQLDVIMRWIEAGAPDN